MERKKYPIGAEFYALYEEIGQGVSASVRRALCIPFNEIVAIKILDFERDNIDLRNISREAQTMILVDHPNVLKSHCSFVSDHNLWVVTPFMAGGSCLHILKAAYTDGFEEVVIATILREVLKALEYLHQHGHIHRDIKALISPSISLNQLSSRPFPKNLSCSSHIYGIVYVAFATESVLEPQLQPKIRKTCRIHILSGKSGSRSISSYQRNPCVPKHYLITGKTILHKGALSEIQTGASDGSNPDRKRRSLFSSYIAGNILVDLRGAIKLGDFGVSAFLFDSGDRQRTRKTFVGTPCWMAPEVMEQLHGYDFKADIWSFGITALELAHGHAPFSKYPPMKVLLMTLQNAPPGLDYERDRKFSKSFKQMIASCLVKDPSKRPSAKKLLKHPFFKQARSNDYIARTILEGLSALGDRLKALKRKEEDMLAQKKMPDGQKEEISQNEYKRGISCWNFNIEDLKAQASLIQDVDEGIFDKDLGGSSKSLFGLDIQESQSQSQFSTMDHLLKDDVADLEADDLMRNQLPPLALADSTVNNLKTRCDKSDDDLGVSGSSSERSISENGLQRLDDQIENNLSGKSELEIIGSDKQQNLPEKMVSCNGVTVLQACVITAANSDDLDEKAKGPIIQQRGRFKVTSESVDLEKVTVMAMALNFLLFELDITSILCFQAISSPMLQKSHSVQVITQIPAISLPLPSDATPSNLLGYSLFPHLHCILQTNILQRENILSLMKQVCTGDLTANRAVDGGYTAVPMTVSEQSLLEAAHDREKELLQEMNELQWR
ncbi:hypothetical protein HHK36_021204 [Tetracentron sinense]|uniref:Protein kinase domain-containing protein n=1 Tax=Tetracentron sinense TaxID=13715 RepID=A0A834YPE4_TETSI|nr:hypothetical protein HHK36_021204 [Tetracentron sinense]